MHMPPIDCIRMTFILGFSHMCSKNIPICFVRPVIIPAYLKKNVNYILNSKGLV